MVICRRAKGDPGREETGEGGGVCAEGVAAGRDQGMRGNKRCLVRLMKQTPAQEWSPEDTPFQAEVSFAKGTACPALGKEGWQLGAPLRLLFLNPLQRKTILMPKWPVWGSVVGSPSTQNQIRVFKEM